MHMCTHFFHSNNDYHYFSDAKCYNLLTMDIRSAKCVWIETTAECVTIHIRAAMNNRFLQIFVN